MVNLLTLRVMIIPGFTRPVIQISDDTTCLVDSGADTPVWTQGLKADESADDKEDRILFKSLTVACTSRPMMVADLILPSTAFSHMNYKVCNIGVDYPVIEIEHEKVEYYVNPIYRSDNDEFVERIYSFAND